MFQLTAEEFAALRSQFATSNKDGTQTATGRGGRRYAPRVFTEHGSLMATTILYSPRAVEVSIYVVRAFVQLRELANTHQGLAKRLDALEDKTEALAMSHDTFSRKRAISSSRFLKRCGNWPHRLSHRHRPSGLLGSSRRRTRRTASLAAPRRRVRRRSAQPPSSS